MVLARFCTDKLINKLGLTDQKTHILLKTMGEKVLFTVKLAWKKSAWTVMTVPHL